MKLIQAFCILILGELSFASSENVGNNTVSIISDYVCTNDRCIMKCCENGKFINNVAVEKKGGGFISVKKCNSFNETKTTTLDEDFDNVFISKPNLFSLELKPGYLQANRSFRFKSMDISVLGLNAYLSERAEVLLEVPNAFDRIRIPNNMYCIDSIMMQTGSGVVLKPGIWTLYSEISNEIQQRNTAIMIAGMLVSCVFLALVLVVYGALPELRNLCGLILMAYVASQLGAFLMLAVMRIKEHGKAVCEELTYIIYFFFLASFCWMNVMSYDIWWTFRGYAKARPIHRRGERFKFLMYCVYAFGLPLAMTIGLAVLNNVDLQHVPWFITPKITSTGCFIDGGEKLLYLYIPMLILILSNWILYIMTAINIWRLSRGTAVVDSGATSSNQARRLNRRRFIIYLKLSVVMGLNWLLEMMSYASAGTSFEFIEYISDCYNILIGVVIFVIFVCKRKIWKKLRQRFATNKKSKWYPAQEDASRTVTSTDNSTTFTQDTQAVPLQSYTIEGARPNQQIRLI